MIEHLGSGTAPILLEADPPSLEAPKASTPKQHAFPVAAPAEGLTSSEQKILDALASLEAVGVRSPSKVQLAAFAGYSNPKSGGFAAPTAALVRKGLIQSTSGKTEMTGEGRALANQPGRPATSKELQDRIFSLLGEGERKLLAILIRTYPDSFTRVELATQGGYSNAKSGGFAAPLARLIELGFVETVRNGIVRGSEMLFLKAKPSHR